MALATRLVEKLGRQLRRPTGRLGSLLGHVMAWEHRALALWGIDLLDPSEGDSVLDVGCGGGMTVKALAKRTAVGLVVGVDHSEVMVRQAQRRNRRLIDSGRVDVRLADATSLQFGDRRFDAVISIESFQFWRDPVAGLREIRRVLRPGGRLALVFETRSEFRTRESRELTEELLGAELYSGSDVTRLLATCGFGSARFEERTRGRGNWLCALALARKPLGSAHA